MINGEGSATAAVLWSGPQCIPKLQQHAHMLTAAVHLSVDLKMHGFLHQSFDCTKVSATDRVPILCDKDKCEWVSH